jgi:hypothetical protein
MRIVLSLQALASQGRLEVNRAVRRRWVETVGCLGQRGCPHGNKEGFKLMKHTKPRQKTCPFLFPLV